MAPDSSRPPARDNSIGLMRLLLAGLVFYGHTWYLAGRAGDEPVGRGLLGGNDTAAGLGVKGFFVLSGYLVLQSERRLASTRQFLVHRLLRIYPALWVCLIVTGLGLPAAAALAGHTGVDGTGAWGYVWRNLILVRQQIDVGGLFPGVPMPGDLNGSLWMLPYLLGCYVIVAALGWLGLTRAESWRPWASAGFVTALYLHDHLWPDRAVFFRTPGRDLCIWFLAGTVAALPAGGIGPRVPGWLAGAGALAFALATRSGFGFVGPVLLAPSVLWLMWHLPGRDLERRLGGDYSYGFYIYAYPLQQAAAAAGALALGLAGYAAVALAATAALAFGSWHAVERHVLRLKVAPSS